MSHHLPDHLDPWRFADLAKRVRGSYPLASLPRLCECLSEAQGEVVFDLEFSRDRQHRAYLQGRVEADLRLECQRCLGVMSYAVRSDIILAFVEGLDEAEHLPQEYDPQLVENGQVALREIIEDELLLSLPQFALHPRGECSTYKGHDVPDDEPMARSNNPFAVLATLKRHDK